MPIVFAAIVPHGFPLIPVLSDDADGALATRAAMEQMEHRFKDARPDTIVIAGPHGVRVDGTICFANVARAAGTLTWNGRQVEMNVPVDGRRTERIASSTRGRGIAIAMAGYGGNRRDQSVLPLDWGLMTPLWFLGHGRNLPGYGNVLAEPPEKDIGPPVVIVTPSRTLGRSALVEFGRALAENAENDRTRYAFIASCDWAHTHRADGPYGFHPAAAEVDAMIVSAIRGDDLGRLISLSEQKANDAAIDGLWQALMLAGITDVVPMRHELLSYEAPSYYGMIVAIYEPLNPSHGR